MAFKLVSSPGYPQLDYQLTQEIVVTTCLTCGDLHFENQLCSRCSSIVVNVPWSVPFPGVMPNSEYITSTVSNQ